MPGGTGCVGSGDKGVCEQEGARVTENAVQGVDTEYTVNVEKSGDQGVGLDIQLQDSASLFIKSVKPGLIEEWNKKNPANQVIPGDVIVEVNGVFGDVPRMVSECKSFQKLTMRLRRPKAEPATILESPVLAPQPESSFPEIRRLRVCLLGGDTFQHGVGKADIAAALLRGITADWPGTSDPVFDFAFDCGVFERAWGELLAEPSNNSSQGGDRWGIGPLGAWCLQGRVHFSSRGRGKSTPPYDTETTEDCASLCPGNSEKLSMGHARSHGICRAFREALGSSGLDLNAFEAIHQQAYSEAESNPRTLIRIDRPCPGILATFARFSPEIGDFFGCGAAILDVFEQGRQPLGNPRNTALLYAAAPNSRVHKSLSPGSFLCALQGAGTNIARMMREYNWLANGQSLTDKQREEWWQTDLRSQVEYYLSDRNLRTDPFFLQMIAPDYEGWVDIEVLMGCDKIVAAGVTTPKEILDALSVSKTVTTKEDDGRAFVRDVSCKLLMAQDAGIAGGVKRKFQDNGNCLGAGLTAGVPPPFPGVISGGMEGPSGGLNDGADGYKGCGKRRVTGTGDSKDLLCWDFAKGFCSRGEWCRYVHLVVPGGKGAESKGNNPQSNYFPQGFPGPPPGSPFEFNGQQAQTLGSADGLFEMPPPPEPFVPTLLPGTRVQILGLSTKPEFNEQVGECQIFDETSSRWLVQLADGSSLRVKEANLRKC